MAAAALMTAGVAVAGTGVAGAQTPPGGPYIWCPGDPPVETGNKTVNPVIGDESFCHEYWFVYHGQGNVAQNIWDGPNPPGPPPAAGVGPAAAASEGMVLGDVPAGAVPAGCTGTVAALGRSFTRAASSG